MNVTDWTEETRIHKYDPIIPHLIKNQKFWVKNHPDIVGYDDLFRISKGDLDREKFIEIAKSVIGLMWETPFESAPFGGHPGGYPYSETTFTVSHVMDPDEGGRQYIADDRTEFRITFGLTEAYWDGTGERPWPIDDWPTEWYVDMKDESLNEYGGDVTDQVIIPWNEISAAKIVGYIKLFMYEAYTRCNHKSAHMMIR